MLYQHGYGISFPVGKQDETYIVYANPFAFLILVGGAGLVSDAGICSLQRGGKACLSGLAGEKGFLNKAGVCRIYGQCPGNETIHEPGCGKGSAPILVASFSILMHIIFGCGNREAFDA